MTETALIESLKKVINGELDQVMPLSFKTAEGNPEILKELSESERRLGLAKNRGLMDDHQVKLAFRVSVKKVIQRLERKLSEMNEEI